MGEPKIRNVGMVDVTFGENVTIVEPVNLYGCVIGDDSSIGPFVEIQRGAVIGKRCRIQSHAFICDMVTIGDDCFISHGAMFINDPFAIGGPAMRNREVVAAYQNWQSCKHRDECNHPACVHLRWSRHWRRVGRNPGHFRTRHLCGQPRASLATSGGTSETFSTGRSGYGNATLS